MPATRATSAPSLAVHQQPQETEPSLGTCRHAADPGWSAGRAHAALHQSDLARARRDYWGMPVPPRTRGVWLTLVSRLAAAFASSLGSSSSTAPASLQSPSAWDSPWFLSRG